MSRRQIAQKVIDFEYSRINAPCQVQHNYQPVNIDKSSQRYSKWNLNSILQQLNLVENTYQTMWVGMGKISLLEAFIYCLLNGTKVNNEQSDNYFVKTKFSLYQLAEKHLSIKQQKELVENLCYAQYTKSIAVYLNKNYGLQSQIKKIFQSYISPINQPLLPIQQLKLFSLHFSFMQFEIVNDNVGLISFNRKKYYIIYEKQCVFIIQKNKDDVQSKSNSPKSNKQRQYNNQESSMKKNMLNSKKDSNARNYIEGSTPKFVNKVETSKKNQKSKRENQIQIQLFDQKQEFQYKHNENIPKQDVKPKSKYIPNINFLKKKDKNEQKNLSLRNTIQMHISILKSYKDKSKNKLRRLSILKSNQKSKQKDKVNISQNLSSKDIPKAKDSSRIPITSQPSIPFLSNQSLLSFNNSSSNTYLRGNRKKSPSQQPNVKFLITQPRVAFTYFSP